MNAQLGQELVPLLLVAVRVLDRLNEHRQPGATLNDGIVHLSRKRGPFPTNPLSLTTGLPNVSSSAFAIASALAFAQINNFSNRKRSTGNFVSSQRTSLRAVAPSLHTHPSAGEPLQLEMEAFLHAVRTRTIPLVSGEDGRAALALALQINQAIAVHAERTGL